MFPLRVFIFLVTLFFLTSGKTSLIFVISFSKATALSCLLCPFSLLPSHNLMNSFQNYILSSLIAAMVCNKLLYLHDSSHADPIESHRLSNKLPCVTTIC